MSQRLRGEIWKSNQKVVMNEDLVQNSVMNEKLVQKGRDE